MGDRLDDMIRDLGQEFLEVVFDGVNVKARYGWSDKSFTLLLQVMHNMLPEKNTLPKSYYQVKKS